MSLEIAGGRRWSRPSRSSGSCLARARPIGRAGRDGRGLRARGTRDRARAARPRRHPGPARGRGAGRRRRGVPARAGAVLLPAWEAFPYELLSPTPEIAARRAAAVRRLRDGRSARGRRAGGRGRPGDRADARARPRRSSSRRATRPRPTSWRTGWSSSGTTRADVVERRGEFAVRGGVLDVFPADAAPPGPARVLGRRDRVDPSASCPRRSCPASAVDARDDRSGARADPRRRRSASARRAAAASVGDERVADLLGTDRRRARCPTGSSRPRRSCGTTMPDAGRAAPRRARGSSSPRRDARSGALRQTYDDAEAAGGGARVARARTSCGSPEDALGDRHAAAPVRRSRRATTSRSAAGAPRRRSRRARRAGCATSRALGYRVVVAAHGHGSLDRAREVLGDLEVEAVEAPLAPGSSSVRARSPCSPRRTSSVRAGSRARRPGSRRAAATRVADELEPGDFAVHRIHGVGRYQGIVHRELAGSERDYLVLEYAKGDKLYVPVRRRRHGRALHRRRRAARASDGRLRLGAGDREGQAGGPRHGGRARPPLHRPDVGAGPRVRSRHAVAARARGRVPVRGDARSAARDRRREARHGAAACRWTGCSAATSGSARRRSRCARRARR